MKDCLSGRANNYKVLELIPRSREKGGREGGKNGGGESQKRETNTKEMLNKYTKELF